jgi:hypothetical protein
MATTPPSSKNYRNQNTRPIMIIQKHHGLHLLTLENKHVLLPKSSHRHHYGYPLKPTIPLEKLYPTTYITQNPDTHSKKAEYIALYAQTATCNILVKPDNLSNNVIENISTTSNIIYENPTLPHIY